MLELPLSLQQVSVRWHLNHILPSLSLELQRISPKWGLCEACLKVNGLLGWLQ